MVKQITRESLEQTLNRINAEQFKADYAALTSEEMQLQYQLSEMRYFELVKLFQLQKYRARKSIEDLCRLIPKETYIAYVQELGIDGLCKHFNINKNQAKTLQTTYGLQFRKSPQTYEEFKSSIDVSAFTKYVRSGKTNYSEFLGTKNNRFINRLLADLNLKKVYSLKELLAKIDYEAFKQDFKYYSIQDLAMKYDTSTYVVKTIMKQLGLKHSATERLYLKEQTMLKNNPDSTLAEVYSIAATKCSETKREKNSANTSTVENFFFEQFKQYYGANNVYRQYSSDKYPFCCDCYISTEDLYIEINGHFTHGFHPFSNKSSEDLARLDIVRQKQGYYTSSTGKIKPNAYFNYEKVWTQLDPAKITHALKNNLKYIMIYMDRAHRLSIYITSNIKIEDYIDLFKMMCENTKYKVTKVCYLEGEIYGKARRKRFISASCG